MSTSAINFSGTPNTATNSSSSSSGVQTLANENVFLQLLVAQLQYQDPTQPADGTQFVTQLAEFTNVSNTTQMTTDLDSMNKNLSTLTTDLTTAPSTTTPPSTSTPTGTTGANINS